MVNHKEAWDAIIRRACRKASPKIGSLSHGSGGRVNLARIHQHASDARSHRDLGTRHLRGAACVVPPQAAQGPGSYRPYSAR